jgi:hypothetical protein
MNQNTREKSNLRRVPARRAVEEARPRHAETYEMRARLRERQKDGDHRRWIQKVGLLSVIGIALAVSVSCGAVLLSGEYSLTEKQLAAVLVVQLFTGLGGFLAGFGLKGSGESWRGHERR